MQSNNEWMYWGELAHEIYPVGGGERIASFPSKEQAERVISLHNKALRAQADARPVLWWNGIRKGEAGDFVGPSFSEKEDTNHDIPLVSAVNPCNYTHPEASAPGLSDAIAWVTKRRDDYIEEFGHIDPDTGALEYGTGKHAEAKREYVGELDEIIEGLQSFTRASAATVGEAKMPDTSDDPVNLLHRVLTIAGFSSEDAEYQKLTDALIGAAQQQAEPGADERVASDAYDKVDRFLRNNLDDVDYAEYSEALESVRVAQSDQRAGLAELSPEQQKQIAWDAHIKATLIPGANLYTSAQMAVEATVAAIAAPTQQREGGK